MQPRGAIGGTSGLQKTTISCTKRFLKKIRGQKSLCFVPSRQRDLGSTCSISTTSSLFPAANTRSASVPAFIIFLHKFHQFFKLDDSNIANLSVWQVSIFSGFQASTDFARNPRIITRNWERSTCPASDVCSRTRIIRKVKRILIFLQNFGDLSQFFKNNLIKIEPI